MIEALEIATFLWMSRWAIQAFRKMSHGENASILLTSLVFYLMFAAPLGCNFLLGTPDYRTVPGFATAAGDPLVRILYCLFLVTTACVWRRFGETKHPDAPAFMNPKAPGRATRRLLIGLVISPIIVALIGPNPARYLHYGFIVAEEGSLSQNEVFFHDLVAAAAFLSIVASSILILASRSPWRSFRYLLPLQAIAVILDGKRTGFALAVVGVVLTLYLRGELKGRRLVAALLIATLALAGFSYAYQSSIREISAAATPKDLLYEGARVDFGRETRVQMAIYSELHPEQMQILDFRGETLLYYAALIVPRDLWPDKPYPYAVYFTGAMLGLSPQYLGWGMTTTIFDEAISNCGLGGLLLGPLVICWVCRVGDARGGATMRLFTILIACLLLSVQMSAFWPLFFLWSAAAFWLFHSTRDARRKRAARGDREVLISMPSLPH